MFDSIIEIIEDHQVVKYQLTESGRVLSFQETVNYWESSEEFRSYFIQLLASSSFDGFRWETPGLTHKTLGRPFEFVLRNASNFARRKSDPIPFRDFFTDQADEGIVAFRNISGDATMIVPSPKTDENAYGHLAAFVRRAPVNQVDMLWKVVARELLHQVSSEPLWLNTAGGGVAWLHIRLDSRPKYYGYRPYTRISE